MLKSKGIFKTTDILKCISNVWAVGVFTIYLIIIYVKNIMNTEKQKHKTIWVNFSRSLSDVLLMIFVNIKCQWDFKMGKNVAQL